MRALLVTVLLVAPVLAGCLGAPQEAAAIEPLQAASLVDLPVEAVVEALPEGLRVVFKDVTLPFEEKFSIPEGTTMVRLAGVAGEQDVLSVAMRNDETGRRRCQTPSVVSWDAPPLGANACVGLTAVDPLPAVWRFNVGGATSATVTIDLLQVAPGGPASQLDLTQLSMPAFDLEETEILRIPSHDGVELHVEVTRPATAVKVPTVIVSTPYNDATRKAGLRPSDDLIKDWGARGYAIVVADVRGYGESDGCVEVWSLNEQLDQVALVDWVAAQAWSDGNVGFYGQSYVATTPVAAAVHAPEALKAIVAVAPVINAYDDWHFGGVPNGEDLLSPVTYQTLGGAVPIGGVPEPDVATRADNGFCDATLAARAGADPRALYDEFYAERNFSAKAKDVKAAVLFTQGFEDSNVKSAMITHWFDALEAPKLGIFGHWVHQHPPIADQETLFLGWMDQYVKGRALGFERLGPALVVANDGTYRMASEWPPEPTQAMFLDFAAMEMGDIAEPPSEATLLLDPLGPGQAPVNPLELLPGTRLLALSTPPLPQRAQIAGAPYVELVGTLERAENGYVAAYLYETDADGKSTLVTWGMVNLAHRFGHDRYEPVQPGETLRVALPLLPTEHAFAAGNTVHLELRGARTNDWAAVKPTEPALLTLHGGEDGTRVVFAAVAEAEALALPPALDWTPVG